MKNGFKKGMLRTLVVALSALLFLPGSVFAAYPNIVIDGQTSDWSAIPTAATNTGALQSLKVTNDGCQLFVLVAGSGLKSATHTNFLFDTDHSASTGYSVHGWSTGGADYMVDNSELYRFTGTSGNQWSWQLVGNITLTKSDTVIELYIPLADLGLTPGGTVDVGVTITTPSGGAQLPALVTPMPAVTLQSDSSETTPNWSTVSAFATGSGSVQSLKAFVNGCKLFLHADGTGLSTATLSDFYINTDNNVATGYHAFGWNSAGADYLIENASVYRFTGANNTAWSWTPAGSGTFTKTNTTIDVSVPLSQLKLAAGKTIRLGLVLDNSTTNRIPAQNADVPAVTLANKYIPATPPSTGVWKNVRNFIVQYSVDYQFDLNLFRDYQAVIIDPTGVTQARVNELRANRQDSYLISYLALGQTRGLLTDASGAPLDIYFKDANGQPILDPNWNTYYVDPRKPLWQDMVLNQYLPELFAKGFDGVFLDVVDVIAYTDPSRNIDFTVAAGGMADLIKAMKLKYPTKKIVANGGFSLLNGGANDIRTAIDGIMMESNSSTWASPKTNPDGSNQEWYHAYPTDSYDYEWGENTVRFLNKIRYVYDTSGNVVKTNGTPQTSSTFFHVFALDYAKDSSSAQVSVMNQATERSWARALLPSVGVKELYLPLPYNWLKTITTTYLTEPNWGAALNIPSMPAPNPTIDDFTAGVGNWHALRGGIDPSAPDAATLSASAGAAKLDFTVRGTKATNDTVHEIVLEKNAAGMVSKEWFNPVDLSSGTVTLKAKISAALPANKAFEIELRDANGDYKVWRNPVTLTTAFQTITLHPATDPGYKPGSLGAKDGFQANQVRSVEIRIVNTTDNSADFTGSLYVDDIVRNP